MLSSQNRFGMCLHRTVCMIMKQACQNLFDIFQTHIASKLCLVQSSMNLLGKECTVTMHIGQIRSGKYQHHRKGKMQSLSLQIHFDMCQSRKKSRILMQSALILTGRIQHCSARTESTQQFQTRSDKCRHHIVCRNLKKKHQRQFDKILHHSKHTKVIVSVRNLSDRFPHCKKHSRRKI